MKETPIIFTTELIPKILDGTKTQTRRLNGLKDINEYADNMKFLGQNKLGEWCWEYFIGDGTSTIKYIKCPYGQVGDRLWVRESYLRYGNTKIFYKANSHLPESKPANTKWKSPRFMHRYESRITLEITGIRVERLQEIDEVDAVEEGMMPQPFNSCELCRVGLCSWHQPVLGQFHNLWNSLNAKRGYSWESNPWVWAIEFKKI